MWDNNVENNNVEGNSVINDNVEDNNVEGNCVVGNCVAKITIRNQNYIIYKTFIMHKTIILV